TIAMPKELAELEPLQVREIMAAQRTLLEQSRQVMTREKSGIESLVALKRSEAGRYEREIARLGQRIEEQTKVFAQLKTLHENKVINQQRFLEAVIVLDNLQRDKQTAAAGLSHVNTDLEKAQRELAKLTLDNNTRIAKELAETEFEI